MNDVFWEAMCLGSQDVGKSCRKANKAHDTVCPHVA